MTNSTTENFSIQGYNLVTLLKRLETATARLEDVTVFQEQRVKSSEGGATKSAVDAPKAVPAIESAAKSAAPAPVAAVAVVPPPVKAFEELIADHVNPLVALSKELDPVLNHQVELLLSAFEKEREVINAALQSKTIKPSDTEFQELIIKPINSIIMKIIELKDGNRTHSSFNALNAMAEGVSVLGWVCVPTPVSYVPEFKDSAQFWTNRVLKDHKNKDDAESKKWVEWVKIYLNVFDQLKAYVKEWATTGLVFKGDKVFGDAISASKSAAASAAVSAPASSGGAPPPPPPPPPPPADLFDNLDKSSAPAAPTGGMGAVFADLNKGEGITSGLKKVDKSQMTHKNPELRKKTVPQPPRKPQSLSTKPASSPVAAAAKPPVKELQDNKWMILNQVDAGLIEIDVAMDQSVFIGNCVGTVVKLNGKVNAVSMNNSTKVGVVIDRAVSSVELNKCKSCEVQVMEWVPVMSIDQSESVNLYLTGEKAADVEIYSSGTTALNINVPDGDDVREMPVAEQFRTVIVDGKLQTVAVSGE